MPKQSFINGVMQITEDDNNPQDKLKGLQKQFKKKGLSVLTVAEKIKLFDTYVEAGVIQL